jgi:DNA-binding transcriptional LysR family regulator
MMGETGASRPWVNFNVGLAANMLREVARFVTQIKGQVHTTELSGCLSISVRQPVTWREAAELPLCLLTRDMQNRRIIDRLFVAGGAGVPKVAVETNSVLSLVAHVRSGEWSSVVPHTFLELLGRDGATFSGSRAIPLVAPEAQQAVGLVVSERDPLSPLVRALVEVAQQFDLTGELAPAVTSPS